jgi:type III restriction enzyme
VKVQLKDFQTASVADLYRRFRLAYQEVRGGGDRQAIVLSSPTGSGKTLMATVLIEQIIKGDGQFAGLEGVSFLWLSDQPELNEQSRRKILATSNVLSMSDLITIENLFDQEEFEPRRLYFLNTQKLGKERHLVTVSDERTYTIWETIANTVRRIPGGLVLIIDEAHKGMMQSPTDTAMATTIVQKFIKGSPGELPPIPLIFGISATPDRFTNLLHGVPGIVPRHVTVDVAEVRESGLIKDKVLVLHPKVALGADWTLLREATELWGKFTTEWAEYSRREQLAKAVRPILVIQVEDASGKRLTATDLTRTLDLIRQVAGPLADGAVAHCFQEKQSIKVDGLTVRSVAPADIQDDPEIRVVLFKLSLNTGWDCPRAEVMMSFRRALDDTAIAQLIGRMVRTPLARRVESDELLNSVALYLPNYDTNAVSRVVKALTTPGDDRISSDVEVSYELPRELSRSPDAAPAFAVLDGLPTYRARRAPPMSNVKRLVALGRYLAQDGLRQQAADEAKATVIGDLQAHRQALARDPEFKAQIEGFTEVEITGLAVEIGGSQTIGESRRVKLEEANLDELFAACGRRLGEGLHLAYVKERTEAGIDPSTAKRELLSLVTRSVVIDRLEEVSLQRIAEWLGEYHPAINRLDEDARVNYNRIRRTAQVPEAIPFKPPLTIQGTTAGDSWAKHVYIDLTDKEFKSSVTGWERSVLEILLGRDEIRWWMRNPPRKEWAFSMVYKDERGDETNMYPDFLVVRQEKTGLAVDIVEPHRTDEGDTARKLLGLAEYATRHSDRFGKIMVVAKTNDDVFRSVDLNDEAARAAAKAVTTTQSVVRLFADYGVPIDHPAGASGH